MTAPRCPCCGAEVAAVSSPADLIPLVSPLMGRIIRRILRTPRAPVSVEALVDCLYGDRADGGPDYAAKAIAVTVHLQNKRIKPHGWKVSAQRGRGSEGYRLIPLPEAVEP